MFCTPTGDQMQLFSPFTYPEGWKHDFLRISSPSEAMIKSLGILCCSMGVSTNVMSGVLPDTSPQSKFSWFYDMQYEISCTLCSVITAISWDVCYRSGFMKLIN
jgi:hypothetical protein